VSPVSPVDKLSLLWQTSTCFSCVWYRKLLF